MRVLDEFVWEDIDDELVEVVDTDFRTLKKSENLEDESLTELFNATPVEKPIVLHAEIDDEKLICAIRPVVRENRIVAYVLLAESAEGAGEYVGILQEVILATLAFLVVFGAGMGYLIAGRLVRPMVAIQETIGEIDLRRLDRRIERVSDDPEVRSLVDTLNGLFERLERSYDEIANFSANVAHELHTPLTILRGTIEVTLSRERKPDEYVRILSDILEETLHTIHIVDSLLMLARSESAAQQPTGEPHPATRIHRPRKGRLGSPLFPEVAATRRSRAGGSFRLRRPVSPCPAATEPRVKRIEIFCRGSNDRSERRSNRYGGVDPFWS